LNGLELRKSRLKKVFEKLAFGKFDAQAVPHESKKHLLLEIFRILNATAARFINTLVSAGNPNKLLVLLPRGVFSDLLTNVRGLLCNVELGGAKGTSKLVDLNELPIDLNALFL
jgi:hypothetical protein